MMSKMGISTYQSYCGAQIFDAVGLSESFLSKYFTGTKCAIGGVGIEGIASESVRRHAIAYQGILQFSGAYERSWRSSSLNPVTLPMLLTCHHSLRRP